MSRDSEAQSVAADDQRSEAPQTQEPSTAGAIAAKIGLYVFGLFLWLVFGGFFSVGPRIAHNIEKAVGWLALDGTLWSWIALPITGLLAVLNPNRVTLLIFGVNLLAWVLFLGYLYFAWINAYPSR